MPKKRRNIGKKKGSQQKQAKKQNKTGERKSAGRTRFIPGDRVQCCMQDKTWEPGQVVQLWWRSSSWPQGQKVPYQVRLDNGKMIFVPFDTSELIKPGPEQALRFDIGTPVMCKVKTDPETWAGGHVIAQHYPLPRNPAVRMPYQILLNKSESNKGLIFAPADDDRYVKFNVAGKPMSSQAKDQITSPEKRRFKIGDLVSCKVGVDPETWEVGEIKALDVDHPMNKKLRLPYQVWLVQRNQMIFAPADTHEVIRKHEGPRPKKKKTLRFSIGDRVTCKISRTEEIWVIGTVIDVNIKQGNYTLPYQIQLDKDQKRIFAPIDHENIIRSIDRHIQPPKTAEVEIPNLDIKRLQEIEKAKADNRQLYDTNEADESNLPQEEKEKEEENTNLVDDIADAIEPEISEKIPLIPEVRAKGDPTSIIKQSNTEEKASEENQSMLSGLFGFLSLD